MLTLAFIAALSITQVAAPPAESVQPLAGEVQAPPVVAQPRDVAQPPPVVAQPPPTDAIPAPDERAPAQAFTPPGWSCVPTTLAQIGVGWLTAATLGAISSPLAAIPFVGPALWSCVLCVATPVAVATVQVILADGIGQRRGALFLPVATACGMQILAAAIPVISGIVAVFGTAALYADILSGRPLRDPVGFAVGAITGYLITIVVTAVVTLVVELLALTLPAVVYQLTSEEKMELDDGFVLPGLFTPNHAPNARPPRVEQMAY